MSNRVVLTLVCLVALALVPLTGCTPPASQDVHFVGGSVTGGGSCCPGATAIESCCPASTAIGDLAIPVPGTTASL